MDRPSNPISNDSKFRDDESTPCPPLANRTMVIVDVDEFEEMEDGKVTIKIHQAGTEFSAR
jgi:hypothetical protein